MIGIINYYKADNYGALLQCYALQKVCDELKINTEIINYNCKYIEYHYKILHFDSVRQMISDIIYLKNRIYKRKSFEKFRKKYLRISSGQYSIDNINSINQFYNAFITGSDQVFNYTNTNFDKTFFLNFVRNGKKCAYAASFGLSEVPNDKIDEYKSLLSGFDSISFREESGVKIFKELLGQDAPCLIDPTLLASKEIWDFSCQIPWENYILVYSLERTDEFIEFVKELSNITKCKVVYIGDLFYLHRLGLNAVFLPNVSPELFVTLFKNAKFIVTNSFHGTAFSIIFQKDFFVKKLKYNSVTNDRFDSILGKLNLKNRVVNNRPDMSVILKHIDYNSVNMILDKERQKAKEFLLLINEYDVK